MATGCEKKNYTKHYTDKQISYRNNLKSPHVWGIIYFIVIWVIILLLINMLKNNKKAIFFNLMLNAMKWSYITHLISLDSFVTDQRITTKHK